MARSGWLAAVLAGALALPGAAAVHASDDDEDPPYLIYIDPETGKYTTVDPQAAPRDAERQSPPRPAGSAPAPADRGYPWSSVAGAAAAGLLVLAGRRLLRHRRRPGAPPGKQVDRPI